MYIAYADMMAKVLHSLNFFSERYSIQQNLAGLTFCFLFQSCAEGEEEEDEEEKEKTFEVLLISQAHCSAFHFIFDSYSEVVLTVCHFIQEKEMEKQKMLYQQARLHDRGAAEMVLQMISASKGRKTHADPSSFL